VHYRSSFVVVKLNKCDIYAWITPFVGANFTRRGRRIYRPPATIVRNKVSGGDLISS